MTEGASRTVEVPRVDALVDQADRLNVSASSLLASVLALCGIKHRARVDAEGICDRN